MKGQEAADRRALHEGGNGRLGGLPLSRRDAALGARGGPEARAAARGDEGSDLRPPALAVVLEMTHKLDVITRLYEENLPDDPTVEQLDRLRFFIKDALLAGAYGD